MTTTPKPTAEQIVDSVMRRPDWDAYDVTTALRDAGLLGGAPAKEQIERAARALHDRQWRNSDTHPRWGEGGHCLSESGHRTEVMEDAAAALAAAAGVAPQEECGHRHPFLDAVCVLPPGHMFGHLSEKPVPQEPSEPKTTFYASQSTPWWAEEVE